ncbi:MAG: kelch repeat-containing protein [Pseudomonadota bacterium]
MPKTTIAIATTTCLLSLLIQPVAVRAETGWTAAAPLPSTRQEIYAATLDGQIYTAGGLAERASTVRDDFNAYDPKSKSWRVLPSLPAGRHHITLTAVAGNIYAVGGFSGGFPDWKPERDSYVFNISSGSWSALPPLPVARGEHVAASVSGKLYVIGGRVAGTPGAANFKDHRDTGRVDVFDPASGSWSRGVDAPTARNSAASVVIDGKIYVVGGRQFLAQPNGSVANVNTGALEVFDPETGFWSKRAPMPAGAGGIAATVLDGKLYVFGGEQWTPSKEVFANTWIYDPATDAWTAGPDLNVPRHGAAAGTIGRRIYVFGGAIETGAGDVADNEVWQVAD